MVSGILLVALRCYVRAFLLRGFGYDDILIIVALVSCVSQCTVRVLMVNIQICYILQASFVIAGVHYGLGSHISMLTISNKVIAFELTILWELL